MATRMACAPAPAGRLSWYKDRTATKELNSVPLESFTLKKVGTVFIFRGCASLFVERLCHFSLLAHAYPCHCYFTAAALPCKGGGNSLKGEQGWEGCGGTSGCWGGRGQGGGKVAVGQQLQRYESRCTYSRTHTYTRTHTPAGWAGAVVAPL